jgi:hypothetical protein
VIGRRRAVSGMAAVLAVGVSRAGGAMAAGVPRGEWTRIHEQSDRDEVRFRRQVHGGAAFDPRRGRIALFGSDEHGQDWTNAPLFFDVAKRRWTRPYPDDDPATYGVDRFGNAVAGPDGDHPWAMHTYGTVTCHEADDTIVVSIDPEHMKPGRFTDALAAVWPRVKRHPTWVLDLATERWRPLASPPVHFFPYATAYDPERRLVMGYKSDGVFELRPRPIGWTKVAGPGLLGYHNSAVFDSRHHALVAFGSNQGSNDIVVYEPAGRRHRKMPTPGRRPPKAQFRPMAFHAGLGQTVLLFDSKTDGEAALSGPGWAETWSYDLGRDAWTQHGARMPFRVGMNYNMVYAARDNLLLLVANEPGRPTSVWALSL